MRNWLLTLFITAAALVAAAAPASADWTITPFVGWNTGGSADVNGASGTNTASKFEHKVDYGASIAGMGAGVFGFEFDLGYSPNFFAASTSSDGLQFSSKSNALTMMGNLIVGVPIGGHGGQLRPYAVGGVGLIRTNVQDAGEVFDVTTKNDFGFNVGGGVMAFFKQNIGIRGDVRYFRGFRGTNNSSTGGFGLSNFQYWRPSVGVSFKF